MKPIRLNAFAMNCVGHQAPGLWTHPRDESWRYHDPDYWVDLARLLERGLFDGIFLADVLGVYDVHDGRPDAALRNATQIPVNDPLLLVPLMAQATRHLGFGVTCSVSYEHPYPFARRMSTLDHLTRGCIGGAAIRSPTRQGRSARSCSAARHISIRHIPQAAFAGHFAGTRDKFMPNHQFRLLHCGSPMRHRIGLQEHCP